MSSAISGSLNLSRAQSQIPIDKAGAASNIQNFSTYDAVELIGYVFVDGSSADYRASVKLSIVKNGAGSYEVAACDIAGDDYSGSPIVSFSMSGSLLQATLDSALVAAESPSESYIRYALSAPAVGGQDNISIDASKIVSGTIDSGVLPEATSSAIGGVWLPQIAEATTGVQGTILNSTFYDIPGLTITLEPGEYILTVHSNFKVDSSSLDSQASGAYQILLDGVPGYALQNALSLYNGAGRFYGFVTGIWKISITNPSTEVKVQGRLAWSGISGATFSQQDIGTSGNVTAVRIA